MFLKVTLINKRVYFDFYKNNFNMASVGYDFSIAKGMATVGVKIFWFPIKFGLDLSKKKCVTRSIGDLNFLLPFCFKLFTFSRWVKLLWSCGLAKNQVWTYLNWEIYQIKLINLQLRSNESTRLQARSDKGNSEEDLG